MVSDDEARLEALDRGKSLAESALEISPDSPEAIILWCANAGTAAGMRQNLSSLFIVRKLEKRLRKLRETHPEHAKAAADRGLGTLYLKAPSVISVGSVDLAKKHLRAAYEKFPDAAENQLAWAELMAHLGKKTEAIALAARVEAAAASPENQLERRDWLARIKEIRDAVED